jgi:hypothetical protein
MDRFLHGTTKHTQSIQTACVEICESKFDRVLFSVIDTPGLDFLEGRELKLERQVSGIIKYLDTQYADTMSEVRWILFRNFVFYRQLRDPGIKGSPAVQGRPAHSFVSVELSVRWFDVTVVFQMYLHGRSRGCFICRNASRPLPASN